MYNSGFPEPEQRGGYGYWVATGRWTIRDAISEKDKRFFFLDATRTALGKKNQRPVRSVLG
jgi:hypothetical protein